MVSHGHCSGQEQMGRIGSQVEGVLELGWLRFACRELANG